LELLGVFVGCHAEAVGINDSSEWVALLVVPVRIEFTAIITRLQSDLGLVDETDNLQIILRIEPLSARYSTGRDDPGAMSRFGAPRNLTSLALTNSIGVTVKI